MGLKGSIKLGIDLTEDKVADLGTSGFVISKAYPWTLTSGVGADQSDLLFSDQRTLGASSNEDLDLAAVLASIYGVSLTFVKLRLFYIKAADANPANVTVSRPAANGVTLFAAASDAIVLEPGADFLYRSPKSGKAVTAATADLINIASGAGGNHIYDVVIIGTSA